MLFTSPVFLVFFTLYLLAHYFLPWRFRSYVIIVGGTIFYSYWKPAFIWIPYGLLFVGFYGVQWIDRTAEKPARRTRLQLVLLALLLPLLVFKYGNFFLNDVLGPLFHLERKFDTAQLPMSISFITFSVIAYVLDVYAGRYPQEKRLSRLAGFLFFFPHMIAGPIMRPRELIPQLRHKERGQRIRLFFGAVIFSVGVLKKLVIADPLAEVVDPVFGAPAAHTALEYLLAIYGFAFQIYMDFSGYTDMAIGLGIILGIRLPKNFLKPYTSSSLIEFWQRCHITLSTWLRDYVFFPLAFQGKKRGFSRYLGAIMLTMAIGGAWHGANWTFIVWGLLHGAVIVATNLSRRMRVGKLLGAVIPRWVFVFLTFQFVVFALVIFRAASMTAALSIFMGLCTSPWGPGGSFAASHAFPLLLLLFSLLWHPFDDHRTIRRWAVALPGPVLAAVMALIYLLAATVSAGVSTKFIYFDF